MKENDNDLAKRIVIGVKRGAAFAVAKHKREGRPIAVWKDGKVVEIPADEIVVPPIPDLPEEI